MFLAFNQEPLSKQKILGKTVANFELGGNIDANTVTSFGEEWSAFNSFTDSEIEYIGNEYFDICETILSEKISVLDVGCGTGRWSKYLSKKVNFIEAIDPSDAIYSAAQLLNINNNVRITRAGVANIPFADNSFDLVFSLGVLHHVPDTFKAITDCVKKVKPNGYFLVYLYYSLDNRGLGYKLLFKISNGFRFVISSLPTFFKKNICNLIALFVYVPFVTLSKCFRFFGLKKIANKIPLSYYTDKSFFVIRNDALDRFGTPLEQRFSKKEIETMMRNAGLTNIHFSNQAPYWHAIGKKQNTDTSL
ncbi:MAG: class I SAM-dependent methyltransferase [Bacteroidia bacterium]|nr:class I SAM-dependent methyltransferase [Bacteroidia bacterium]